MGNQPYVQGTAVLNLAAQGFLGQGAAVVTTLQSISNAGRGTRDVLSGLSTSAALSGGAIAFGLRKVMFSASDLYETINKAQSIFGASTQTIIDFAQDSAKALGLTRRDAIEAAASFGNLFYNMKYTQREAAGMSMALVKLASDLGSLYNVDVPEVLDDIRSGLVGQSRPLRQYGIVLNEAAVSQEALAQTGKASKLALTEADRVLARYTLILRFSNTATGDFTQTSNAAANSIRIMESELGNASAALGQGLLPGVVVITHAVADLAAMFQAVPSALRSTLVTSAAMVAGTLLLAGALGKLTTTALGTAQAFKALYLASQRAGVSTASFIRGVGISAGLAVIAYEALKVKAAFDAAGQTTENLKNQIQDLDLISREFSAQNMSQAAEDAKQLSETLGFMAKQASAAVDAAQIHGDSLFSVDTLDKINEGMPWSDSDNPWETARDAQEKLLVTNRQVLLALQSSELNTTKFLEAVQALADEYMRTGDIDAYVAGVKNITDNIEDYAMSANTAEEAQEAFNEAVEKGIANAADAYQEGIVQAEVQRQVNEEWLKTTNLLLPYTRGMDDVAKATEDFNMRLENLVQRLAEGRSGLVDMSEELPGLQTGYQKAGDSIFRMLLRARDAGDIDMSKAEAHALRVADALYKTERAIESMDAAINNNQQDIKMWQGRIDLVDQVLGSNRDTLAEWEQQLAAGEVTQEEFNEAVANGEAVRAFDNLKDLLDSGRISQEEYDEILAKGIWLRERAVGGIADEQAEIAKLIPAYAEYVAQHDADHQALEDLSPAQQARIYALQEENAQTLIQTALMIKLLEVMGQIPPEMGTQLLLDLTAFDPAMRGVLEDYGLLGEGTTVPVKADTTEFEQTVDNLDLNPFDEPDAGGDAAKGVEEAKGAAETAGEEVGQAAVTGMESGSAGARNIGQQAGSEAAAGLRAEHNNLFNAGWEGGYWADMGLVAGLQYAAPEVFKQAKIIADGVRANMEAALDSHSPSRVTEEIGRQADVGLAIGLSKSRASKIAAMQSADKIQWAMSRGFGATDPVARAGGLNGYAALQPSSSPAVTVQGGNTYGDLVIAPVFDGITDTNEIMNELRTEVVDGLNRWSEGQA